MQQLTDALLDMESERSIWTAKEKEYVEANHRLNICLDENRKLSEDLMKVPLIGLHFFSSPNVCIYQVDFSYLGIA